MKSKRRLLPIKELKVFWMEEIPYQISMNMQPHNPSNCKRCMSNKEKSWL